MSLQGRNGPWLERGLLLVPWMAGWGWASQSVPGRPCRFFDGFLRRKAGNGLLRAPHSRRTGFGMVFAIIPAHLSPRPKLLSLQAVKRPQPWGFSCAAQAFFTVSGSEGRVKNADGRGCFCHAHALFDLIRWG